MSSPAEVVAAAQALLAAGDPFAAHEVLEEEWKAVRDTDRDGERDFWRGLAQAAVAAEHARRGNSVGEATLRERAALTLEVAAGTVAFGVDVDRLRTDLRAGAPIHLR
jgi:predicted metal-dependent hydrolase